LKFAGIAHPTSRTGVIKQPEYTKISLGKIIHSPKIANIFGIYLLKPAIFGKKKNLSNTGT